MNIESDYPFDSVNLSPRESPTTNAFLPLSRVPGPCLALSEKFVKTRLERGETPECAVAARNTGNAVLNLKVRVEDSAREWLTLAPASQEIQLAPGEIRDIRCRIAFDPEAKAGLYNGRIAFVSDSIIEPLLSVPVRAELIEPPPVALCWEPLELDFGLVAAGEKPQLQFTVWREDDKPFRPDVSWIYKQGADWLEVESLAGSDSSRRQFRVTASPPEAGAAPGAGNTWQAFVAIKGEAVHLTQAAVRVSIARKPMPTCTISPQTLEAEPLLPGSAAAALLQKTQVPKTLVFGRLMPGSRARKAILISNQGEIPLEISLQVRDPQQWFSIGSQELTVKPGKEASVPVSLQLPTDFDAGWYERASSWRPELEIRGNFLKQKDYIRLKVEILNYLRAAPRKRRIIAASLDHFFLATVIGLVAAVLRVGLTEYGFFLIVPWLWALLALHPIYFIYFTAAYATTPGKHMQNLWLWDLRRRRPAYGFRLALLRYLSYPLALPGRFIFFREPNGRGLHDLLNHTVVIQKNKASHSAET